LVIYENEARPVSIAVQNFLAAFETFSTALKVPDSRFERRYKRVSNVVGFTKSALF
jgi:hypothetical protein